MRHSTPGQACQLGPYPPPTPKTAAFVNGFILVIVANVPEVTKLSTLRSAPGLRNRAGAVECGVCALPPRQHATPHMRRPIQPPHPTPMHPARQGLPATVTSLLTLTALRLRDRRVLIKRTDIIENLGVATIIARWNLAAGRPWLPGVRANAFRARSRKT